MSEDVPERSPVTPPDPCVYGLEVGVDGDRG